MTAEQARPFWLIRDETIVADGVKFPDNTTVIRWRMLGWLKPTTAIHDDLGSVIAIHSRSGTIRAAWCDINQAVTEKDTKEQSGFA